MRGFDVVRIVAMVVGLGLAGVSVLSAVVSWPVFVFGVVLLFGGLFSVVEERDWDLLGDDG
jgi:hypothetical protein